MPQVLLLSLGDMEAQDPGIGIEGDVWVSHCEAAQARIVAVRLMGLRKSGLG
jgi:hypothetical protein